VKKTALLGIPLVLIAVAVVFMVFIQPQANAAPSGKTYPYSPGEFFETYLRDSTHILKVSVVLRLNTDKLTSTLTENNDRIRDTITYVFRSTDAEIMLDVDKTYEVKATLIAALNALLETDSVVEINYNDYITL
jgi:flagellar basal body-associated protein FliL